MENKTKSTGAVLWSKRKEVSTNMAAWHDVITYEVPVVGTYDRNKIWSAMSARFNKPGHIAGSSYGSTSISLGEYNSETKTILISFSFGIGD